MGKGFRSGETPVPVAPMQHATNMSKEELRREEREYRLEEEWQSRLRTLEQWICKLLIKNEQLRMSLASAAAPDGATRAAADSRSWQRASQADEP